MRVLMTGGGTGGHVNPAIAIANTIKENESVTTHVQHFPIPLFNQSCPTVFVFFFTPLDSCQVII